ncbi:MAG: SseB family protein [Planktomarina sp.]
MTEQTALDRAFLALESDPDDTTARLRYFERVMDAEVFVPMAGGNEEAVTPVSEVMDGVEYVLAFDLEQHLADDAGGLMDYFTVSGRGLVEMLVGQGAGVLLNKGQRSENAVAPETIEWLAQMSGVTPDMVDDTPEELLPPLGLDEGLILALDAKFSTMRGLASHATLVMARYADDRKQPLVGVFGALEDAQPDIARAVTEAAQFSGAELDAVDLVFLPTDHAVAGKMDAVGLKFQIPRAEVPQQVAPGSDPAKPPRLN